MTLSEKGMSLSVNGAPSERVSRNSGRNSDRCSSAAPPPGTMPSSTAANVAFLASSIRSFRSSSSTSVAAPTCNWSRVWDLGGLVDGLWYVRFLLNIKVQ